MISKINKNGSRIPVIVVDLQVNKSIKYISISEQQELLLLTLMQYEESL